MTKPCEKIFRTVVFAGAMLGAPLVSADAPQQPTKAPDSKKRDTVDSVTKEIAAADGDIKKAADAVASAQNQADRDAAQARLEMRRRQKADLERTLAELRKSKPVTPETPLQKLERELAAVEVEIGKAADAVASAQTQADREAANAKLAQRKKQKAELEHKRGELRKSTAQTPLQQLERELAALDVRIGAAVDAVVSAQNDADRKTAKAKLEALRAERVRLEQKSAAEREKLARPRTPETERPIGRGFVLA